MIERWIERAMQAIAVLLGAGLLFGVAINMANVVGRYVFSQSILGADEAQVFLMVWMAFLGAAVVTWRNDHLRMDLLIKRLAPAAQRAVRIVEAVLLLGLAIFVCVQSTRYVAQMLAIDRRSDALGLPMAIPHAAVLVGFILIAIIALLRVAQAARGKEAA